MTTSSPLQALRKPGRVIAAISPQVFDFSTAFPHGGTELGLVRDVRWRRTEGQEDVPQEEMGVTIHNTVYLGDLHVLTFALRGEDNDAFGAVFPNTLVGTSGGKTGISYPGSGAKQRDPGTLRRADAVPIAFIPDDTKNHLAVYYRLAIPQVARELVVSFGRSAQEEALIACGFKAIVDATTPTGSMQVQLLEDLVA